MRKKQELNLLDKFKPKKHESLKVVGLMKNSIWVKRNRIENISHCGSFLQFLSDESKEKHKLIRANFCRDRFCPMCQWRLSVKESYTLSVVLKAIQKEQNYRFIFITLTAPNVKGNQLDDEIKLFSRSFANLIRRVNRKSKIIKGYVRKIEVTYNEDRQDYHPHIHALLAVNKSYFQGGIYLSRQDWLQLWREVTGKTGVDELGRNEISQLDIKAVKDLEGAAIEVGKYTVKSMDFLYSQEVFDIFLKVLKGKRLISFGGVFKEYRDKFKKGDLDSYKEIDLTEYVYRLWLIWRPEKEDYERVYDLLSDEAKAVYNKAIRNHENIGQIDLV